MLSGVSKRGRSATTHLNQTEYPGYVSRITEVIAKKPGPPLGIDRACFLTSRILAPYFHRSRLAVGRRMCHPVIGIRRGMTSVFRERVHFRAGCWSSQDCPLFPSERSIRPRHRPLSMTTHRPEKMIPIRDLCTNHPPSAISND